MRILLLSIVNPVVERNGASTVTRGLVRLLESPPLGARVECLAVRAEPVRRHRLAQARALLRGALSSLPAKPAFLYSRAFRERVTARLAGGRYDLAIVNGGDLLWIADCLPASGARILIAHNIEHAVFEAQAGNTRWHRPLKPLLRAEFERLKDWELSGMRRMGNVIFLSPEDAAYARGFCGELHSMAVPPVFDYQPANRQPRDPAPLLELGLVGNFRWWPNRLAVRWFLDEVLPHVKTPLRLNLFGPPAGRGWTAEPRVREHGPVEAMGQVWERCDFMICPAFAPGGVSVKLAEAAYNRVPVLATRSAARGLPVGEDPALVFRDRPEEWIDFLNSPDARRLAGRLPAEKTSRMFAIDTWRDPLQRFVGESLR